MTIKTPPQFSIKDWQHYVFAAVKREIRKPWNVKPHVIAAWTRKLKDLLRDEVNPYMLALAIDVLALNWDSWKMTSPWEVLAPGSLFLPFRRYLRPMPFWRAVWFSRYARDKHEVLYYSYHLTQLEVSFEIPEGNWGKTELAKRSRQGLAKAEEVIVGRDTSPVFKLHWLRDRLGNV